MLTPPVGLDESELLVFLKSNYRQLENVDRMAFEPLGEDSWAFGAGEYWVSLRRDLLGHHAEAYQASYELNKQGLEFVVAPLLSSEGKLVHYYGDFPVVVFPREQAVTLLVHPRPVPPSEIAAMLERVHAGKVRAELPREDFGLFFVPGLLQAMESNSARREIVGPYSRRLIELIDDRGAYIRDLVEEARGVASACRAGAAGFVLTHGEPSAGNILARADGTLLLIDWGAAAWGPPERDWYHVNRTLAAAVSGSVAHMRYYELKWILSEIAEYVGYFSGAHGVDEDDVARWSRLTRYLPAGSSASDVNRRSIHPAASSQQR